MYNDETMGFARAFVSAQVLYGFSESEKRVLDLFFTNINKKVFFIKVLPPDLAASLMAMYSRIKNPRGLRGIFVDVMLPNILAGTLQNVEDSTAFIARNGITSLGKFLSYGSECLKAYERFLTNFHIDPDYFTMLVSTAKVRKMLSMFMDTYGHNSIGRMGDLLFGCENISIIAAKSLEWNRLGSRFEDEDDIDDQEIADAGFIELSTRYVDMSGKGCYPIGEELIATFGIGARPTALQIDALTAESFEFYRGLAGDNFDGIFPNFLRNHYGELFKDNEKDLQSGVVGETCDVLGNLLPSSTLTSLGVHVTGEAFSPLLQHLILDNTPETIALAELILEESKNVGGDQFARHLDPTEWKRAHTNYLSLGTFQQLASARIPRVQVRSNTTYMRIMAEQNLIAAFNAREGAKPCTRVNTILKNEAFATERGSHDKLPYEFERAGEATYFYVMSWRGWRDLQRHVMCTHNRTRVTPWLGFYAYDKPAPVELHAAFKRIHTLNAELYRILEVNAPPQLCEYPMALGNLVGATLGSNLRQTEFLTWQRSKFDVNHEVRQIALGIDTCNQRIFCPWWSSPKVSRTDRTLAYVFARGSKGVPLKS